MYGHLPYSSIPYSAFREQIAATPSTFPSSPPNPTLGRRPVVTQLTWTDSFKLPLQQTLPENQYEWPVPKGPLRAPDYTWICSLTTQGIPQPPSPYNQYDWPNPKGPLFPISLLTYTDAFKLPYQEFLPPRQLDWPVPRGAPYAISLGTWWQFSLPTPPPLPEVLDQRVRDWPNPRGPRFPVSLLFWSYSTLRYIGQDRPHRQRDWPNPVRRKTDITRHILTVAGSKPQYPPEPQVPPMQTLARHEARVRFLKNEIGRVRFLSKIVIE